MPSSDATALQNVTNRTPLPTPRTALVGNSRKRRASPISISEAAVRAGQTNPRKRRLVSVPTETGSSHSARNASLSRLRSIQTSTPLTPTLASHEVSRERRSASRNARQRQNSQGYSRPSTAAGSDDEEDCQVLSPRSASTQTPSFRDEDVSQTAATQNSIPTWNAESNGTMTPNAEDETGQNSTNNLSSTGQRRPRPATLDTSAAQDASLPSPSLSPVTAAANLQNRRSYFDLSRGGNRLTRASSGLPSTEIQRLTASQLSNQTPQDLQDWSLTQQEAETADLVPSNDALMKLPNIIDVFESMPEEMKSYVMYQMLRRCSKPVLHTVADIVNPALKCDFLRHLPPELCINIIGYLDFQSLCAASQVSKHWRLVIDSSEKVWKRLFDADGYQLQEGELARGVREGWGWQFASNFGEYEKDLSEITTSIPSDTELHTESSVQASSPSTLKPPTSLATKRVRKKSKAKSKGVSRKQLQVSQSSSSMDVDDERFLDMITASDGPYAAATAAAAAVPLPSIGLPSLRNLHLFKSIYMRHHIIRHTWMNDEVAPRHLAFRAHQRHVVTCLQFDSDKILTGSDDQNINVYDTQTGALRATLEGHEGGVWALHYEGNMLVSGSTDRSVRVWDIERARCTHVFQGHTSTVRCLQILSPTQVGKTADGKPIMMPKQPLIITGSRDSNLRVWKLPKPCDPEVHQTAPAPDEASECPWFVRALTGHHHSVRAIAAHADTLVSGSYDFTVRVWKISTGETVHRLQGHTQKVYSVVLDHKRNRCISGSMDFVVRVWSLETGTPLFNLEGHSSLVGLLDLQQDRLVSAAADSTLRIWDPENGQWKATLSAHTGAITCFQHDGQKVISGSDRTLKMWDVTTGSFVKDLLTDLSGVWQVKFNERRCVAAVQRNSLTYIEVFYFYPKYSIELCANVKLGPGFRCPPRWCTCK